MKLNDWFIVFNFLIFLFLLFLFLFGQNSIVENFNINLFPIKIINKILKLDWPKYFLAQYLMFWNICFNQLYKDVELLILLQIT